MELVKYKDWSPGPADPKGLNADIVGGENYVVPVIRFGDGDKSREYRFRRTLKRLGGESDEVKVHRFGHWAVGWFEIIVVECGGKKEKILRQMVRERTEREGDR